MSKVKDFICFFPSDWLSDIHLHQCSPEARGVWIDMLCIMAKSEKYGHLINGDGRPIPLERLAWIIRISKTRLQACLDELEREGIFSRDGDVIYCRRMIRDEKRILAKREAGKERVARYRERQESSPKHSCESPPNRTNPWDYFVARGYGNGQTDWERAGRPDPADIKRMEMGKEPWPDNAYWSGGKRK